MYIRAMTEEIIIRRGIETDVPAALELVKELAVFENAPDAVKVTPEEMTKAGFGRDKIFEFFVAEYAGVVVGLALYYYKYSTWKGRCLYLDDLIVTSSYRGRGIGKQLIEAVLRTGREQGVRRAEWQVLDWNKDAIDFYRSFGVVLDEEWINCHYYFSNE
jgi:GNAT superfamily N-acetyltransferase